MFVAALLNFIISFSFTLGATQLGGTLLGILTYKENKDYFPKWYILLGYNAIAAFLIALSYTIFINYAPIVYKQAKLNNGRISLHTDSKDWMHPVVIKIEKERVKYSLCNNNYDIDNNMYAFYNSLNTALEKCSLPEFTKINVSIVENPFKDIEIRSTNSIIRKHVMN